MNIVKIIKGWAIIFFVGCLLELAFFPVGNMPLMFDVSMSWLYICGILCIVSIVVWHTQHKRKGKDENPTRYE